MNKSAVLLLLFVAHTASASFLETSKRYVSPKDMFTLLAQKFPLLNEPKAQTIKNSCWVIGGNNVIGGGNTNLIGLVNPALGVPAITQPSSGFVRFWGDCADRIVNNQFHELTLKPADEQLWRRFWAQSILDRFRDRTKPADPFHKLKTLDWDGLSNRNKDDQIRFLVEEFIGPNAVIADMKLVKGTDELVELIKQSITGGAGVKIFDANKQVILAVILREEFITY